MTHTSCIDQQTQNTLSGSGKVLSMESPTMNMWPSGRQLKVYIFKLDYSMSTITGCLPLVHVCTLTWPTSTAGAVTLQSLSPVWVQQQVDTDSGWPCCCFFWGCHHQPGHEQPNNTGRISSCCDAASASDVCSRRLSHRCEGLTNMFVLFSGYCTWIKMEITDELSWTDGLLHYGFTCNRFLSLELSPCSFMHLCTSEVTVSIHGDTCLMFT